MILIGVGQVTVVLVYRILDAFQPQPVKFGIFFIGNEPAIRCKGVSIGGVCHLDYNKTLILVDGHLNEPALGVGDLLASVQSVFHLVPRNCAQIYGGDLRKAGRKLHIVSEVDLGAVCLRCGAVDNSVNDVVSATAHSDIPIGNIKKGLDVFLGFLVPGLFGKPQYRLEVVVKIVDALGVFLQILVERLIPFQETSEGFFDMFDVVIQLGAILAVVVLFWNKIWPFYMKKNQQTKKGGIVRSKKDFTVGNVALSMDAFWMWVKIVVACIPAVVYGLLFDDAVSEAFKKEIGTSGVTVQVIVVAVMLVLVGVLFIVIENWNKNRVPTTTTLSQLTYRDALIIGFCQLVAAALPGTSRSGATILGAIMIGISRTVAAEFTFFLAIPVMFGASLLKVLKFGFAFTGMELACLLVGTVISFIVSLFVLRFLMGYIKKHDFKVFGWYRIVLGIIVLLYFLVFA